MDLISVATSLIITIIIVAIFRYVKENKISSKLKNKNKIQNESDIAPSIKILYGTQTGTSKALASKLMDTLNEKNMKAVVIPMNEYEIDDLKWESIIVLIVSTYEGGKPPANAEAFYQQLKEDALDFRVHKNELKNVRYAIFGLGHSDYGNNFNKVAKNLDKFLKKLSSKALVRSYYADTASSKDIYDQFETFTTSLLKGAEYHLSFKKVKEGQDIESDSDDEKTEDLVDVEDLGLSMKSNKNKSIDDEEDEEDDLMDISGEPKEMVTPTLRKALTKQGYKILGSHSGVKLCRWTKSMLRGRGGCYKHTFYGISSFQCMEMTPSLACANKCVFCWRHHKNPVGTSWRWKVDDPQMLIEKAIENHRQMIKQLRGVPGVDPERFKEASRIRHCALSLVGEPIIYPHINEFLGLLHEREISSFLVTNAQFPEEMAKLPPITQMYISVDASTKASLKAVDRPLFSDFWERFLDSIDQLAKKGQRTVFRLTLIKEWNMNEISNYADLILRGKPGFVEVKGVTYCGSSDASPLRMTNVPFHEEVVKFTQMICDEVNKKHGSILYEIACEHEHSCCVLMANATKFKKEDGWHTWINYDKFHELVKSGKPFVDIDYMEKTPSWAIFGSEERGFNPSETRFRRNPNKKPSQGC